MRDIGELGIERQAGAFAALLRLDVASRHALREQPRSGGCHDRALQDGPSSYAHSCDSVA